MGSGGVWPLKTGAGYSTMGDVSGASSSGGVANGVFENPDIVSRGGDRGPAVRTTSGCLNISEARVETSTSSRSGDGGGVG